jgi:hypothetical protein
VISRLLLLLLPLVAACQSKTAAGAAQTRESEQDQRFHKAGLVLLADLQHASAWEKLIHADMGVPNRKIEVQAGPGFTTILIKDLNNRADAESVAQEFRQIAAKQPDKYGATNVEVRLDHAAQTINPFSLPSEMSPATVNPGSALPTLSLPPLQLDGR